MAGRAEWLERPHWLRPNAASRVPRRWVTLDTEALVDRDTRGTTQTWRCGVAALDDLDRRDPADGPVEVVATCDRGELWDRIVRWCRSGHRTVVVAHNAGYDLRVSGALVELERRGWRCEWLRLDGVTATARWRRGSTSLVLVDLWSWLPHPLAEMAEMLGVGRDRRPPPDAPDDDWLAWCRGDVEVTRLAFARVLAATRERDWGDWRTSGPAQAMAAFRHRWLAGAKVLVGCPPGTVEPEREAAHAGRCEAWRHGVVEGPVAEWDYAACYAHVARDVEVPVKPMFQVVGGRAADLHRRLAHLRRCALVRVTTDVPVVPCRRDGRVVWPVGTFTTWLWDAEVDLAAEVGAEVEVLAVRFWRSCALLRPAMAELLRTCDPGCGDPDPVVRAVAKQFTRTLVGRFGMRHHEWADIGEADADDVVLSALVDTTTGERTRLLQVGRRLVVEGGVRDAPTAQPAVMAYVMAVARVRLWRAMEAAGPGHVVYVDTDALMVDPAGDVALAEAVAAGRITGLRRKAVHEVVEVLGPRQLVVDGRARAAGLPRRARRVGERTWQAEVWQRLPASLAAREPAVVRTAVRRITLRGTDLRRLHLEGGATAPVTVEGDGHLAPPGSPLP